MDLNDRDPKLIEALRELGNRWGPLGVALTAAQLTDPKVLILLLQGENTMPDVSNPQAAGESGPEVMAPVPVDGSTGLPRADGVYHGQPFEGEALEAAKQIDRDAGRLHVDKQPESAPES